MVHMDPFGRRLARQVKNDPVIRREVLEAHAPVGSDLI